MSTWNINYQTDLISSLSQSMYTTDPTASSHLSAVNNNVTGVSSEYARILSEEINKVTNQMQSSFDQQRRELAQGTVMPEIEFVKRFKPDGSIWITRYEDGKATGVIKKKPHMVPVEDFSVPPDPLGEPAIKMEPRFSLAERIMM